MHQRTQEIVAAGNVSPLRPEHALSKRLQSAGGTGAAPVLRPGTPVTTLPLIGPVLASDQAAYEALRLEMDELGVLANALKSRPGRPLTFKAALVHLGMPGADALTEEEAAAEFIRRVNRFDSMLGKWKEALALGPWDFSGVELWKPPSPQAGEPRTILLLRLANLTQSVWGSLAEASWRTQDPTAAWRHFQSMAQNADRVGDPGHLLSTLAQAGLRRQTSETLRVGIQLGGWSDDHLAAIPAELGRTRVLDDVRRGVEGEKRQQEIWLQGIGSPGNPITDSLVSPFNSPTTNFKNQIALSLITQQQVADNLAVMHQALDRPLGYFDPETGVLQSSVPDRRASPAAAHESRSWFENFYFMFAGGPSAGVVADTLPHTIIRTQTSLDHARLAAALEWHQRRDGQYPASLEAVAGFFPDGLPPDPSTGEPYRYERGADGSYRLWGRGMDRTDNTADARNDVVWTGGTSP